MKITKCHLFSTILVAIIVCICQDKTTSAAETTTVTKNATTNADPDPTTANLTTIQTTTAGVTTAATTAITTAATTAVTTDVTEVFTVTETTDVTTGITTEATTVSLTPTTKPSTTPSIPIHPPVGVWSVKDDKNRVCMKMHFGARFVIDYYKNDNTLATATIDVPKTATAVAKCKTGDKYRKLKLHLFNDGAQDTFHLELTFNNTGSGYTLTQVGSNYTLNPLWFDNPRDAFKVSYQSSSTKNFLNNTIPLHNSFTCAHTLNFSMVYFTLFDVKFMPYADEAKGDFGEAVDCENSSGGSTNIGLIVGLVTAAIFVLIIIAVICFMKKRRAPSDEDAEPILKS